MVGRFILNWFVCLIFFLLSWGVVAWSELGGALDLVVTAGLAGLFSLLLMIDHHDEGRSR